MKVYTNLLNGCVFDVRDSKRVEIKGTRDMQYLTPVAMTEVSTDDWNDIKALYAEHPYIKNKVVYEAKSENEANSIAKDSKPEVDFLRSNNIGGMERVAK